ncbi:S-layer homology domain-containing protein [Citricoccus sp. SGAir0253]|uniref:S-layer homology domain-containing protein n=1 Tax=Citricoccus sp. SGAir0253 TaxID=2567881 RepID=UPI0010CD05FB|nr:S-layer homology domain-containing protein [Citricoccus sp. SGAir0253]QCU77585.1 S-layer homology domain-containing protein [Citricoccus sp. SGAir0253]
MVAHTNRRRLAAALTAAAASSALVLSGAGAATAAPASSETASECLGASFPGTSGRTTPAAVDEWLGCMGLTDGSAYADPGITRGEAAEIVHAAVGAGDSGSAAVFGDVPAGASGFDAVNWLGTSGVAHGYADGEFKPERSITRDELAIFLVGAALVAGPDAGGGTGGGSAGGAESDGEATGDGTEPASGAGRQESAAGAYEERARELLAAYGCSDAALEVVETFEDPAATGMTTMAPGRPATVQVAAGLPGDSLRHTMAHECMHVQQHAVSGYDLAAGREMLEDWYSEEYTSSWGRVSVYEQNAECALQTLGFTRADSSYDVRCDEAGLEAGAAIAAGRAPGKAAAAG